LLIKNLSLRKTIALSKFSPGLKNSNAMPADSSN
jgi:hypothetical protein